MSTELVVVEGLQPVEIFTTEKVTELLGKIEKRIGEFVPDISTEKGKKEIVSFAMQITKSKTLLDGIGKDYVAIIKEEPKRIDAERKRIRDTLDKWAENVRRPVTELEEKEKARISAHEAALLAITQLTVFPSESPTVEEILQRIDAWKALAQREWEEFADRSREYFGKAHDALNAKLEYRKKYDVDQAELAKLRKEKEEQDQKDRDAKLISDALAEKERQDAAAQDKAFSALNQPEPSAPEPIKEAVTHVKSATIAPDPRTVINNKIMASFVAHGFSDLDAKRIVVLIAQGKIQHVIINYGIADMLKNDPAQIMMAW